MGETALTFDHGPNGTFTRSGECCRCGECCTEGDPFGGDMGAAAIAGACPLLAVREREFVCTDRQNPYYLNGCNVWPTHPDQIADKAGCSYRFERVI